MLTNPTVFPAFCRFRLSPEPLQPTTITVTAKVFLLVKMEPSGAVFAYDNVVQEDAPEDADGEFFEDEIVFDEDVPEDDLNDGVFYEEEPDTITPVPRPLYSEHRHRQHKKVLYICMILFIIVLSTLAVVLTYKLQEAKTNGASMSRKEQLITFLVSRGISYEDLLRSFGTAQGQALAFLVEEDWDGEMVWLYRDIDSDPTRLIERYVLALIYFECEGLDWFHSYQFLSAQNHCDWNAVFPSSGEATIEGVTSCSDDGYVERLYFRKYNGVRII